MQADTILLLLNSDPLADGFFVKSEGGSSSLSHCENFFVALGSGGEKLSIFLNRIQFHLSELFLEHLYEFRYKI